MPDVPVVSLQGPSHTEQLQKRPDLLLEKRHQHPKAPAKTPAQRPRNHGAPDPVEAAAPLGRPFLHRDVLVEQARQEDHAAGGRNLPTLHVTSSG